MLFQVGHQLETYEDVYDVIDDVSFNFHRFKSKAENWTEADFRYSNAMPALGSLLKAEKHAVEGRSGLKTPLIDCLGMSLITSEVSSCDQRVVTVDVSGLGCTELFHAVSSSVPQVLRLEGGSCPDCSGCASQRWQLAVVLCSNWSGVPGNLYLYSPSADEFVGNPKASDVIKNLIASWLLRMRIPSDLVTSSTETARNCWTLWRSVRRSEWPMATVEASKAHVDAKDVEAVGGVGRIGSHKCIVSQLSLSIIISSQCGPEMMAWIKELSQSFFRQMYFVSGQ